MKLFVSLPKRMLKRADRGPRFVKRAQIGRCPFCGAFGHQQSNSVAPYYYRVRCNSRRCRAEGPQRRSAAKAIEAWNQWPYKYVSN